MPRISGALQHARSSPFGRPGWRRWAVFALLAWLLAFCTAPVRTGQEVTVRILADGQTHTVTLPSGQTVAQALERAGIERNDLDRIEPPGYTLVRDGMTVRVIRIEEDFVQEEEIIPFERRTLRNEALPEGEIRLVQRGVNGLKRVTYRILREDGKETARQVVKVEVVKEAVPEIVMVGVRQPFLAQPIPGRLAYLAGGNAWVMDGNTGARRPVVLTGDLDGRVFRLSLDGRWLLFSRKGQEEGPINTLWVVDLEAAEPQPLPLPAENVVHFAGFGPIQQWLIAYSTVEPRPGPPGWQANNDLRFLPLREEGPGKPRVVVETHAGGIYGWWGTTYRWHPRGRTLAYARPDQVGTVDVRKGVLEPWLTFVPYRAQGDWAWVPGVAWAPTGDVLFTVLHGNPEEPVEEEDPVFHLVALAPDYWTGPLMLAEHTGMFAYPVTSPLRTLPTGEQAYWVAYLQALFPHQSDTSRYRLMVMDRDGSNKRALFPEEGAPGLTPQEVRWSPGPLDEKGQWAIALIYQGNLYLVQVPTGKPLQLTTDALVTALDWR